MLPAGEHPGVTSDARSSLKLLDADDAPVECVCPGATYTLKVHVMERTTQAI
jgi:hypothetical protein